MEDPSPPSHLKWESSCSSIVCVYHIIVKGPLSRGMSMDRTQLESYSFSRCVQYLEKPLTSLVSQFAEWKWPGTWSPSVPYSLYDLGQVLAFLSLRFFAGKYGTIIPGQRVLLNEIM